MPQFNPVYGELLSSREVSEMTGFTMNQLRNQRQKPELSPFPFLKLGGTSLYRKTDIMNWIEDNGGIEASYVVMPHHKASPLEISSENFEKRESIAKLASITTKNAWTSMATWFIEESGFPKATQFVHEQGREILALERGIADWKTIARPNNDLKASDPDAFWKIWTYGVRKGFATVNDLDVTNEDIMSIPVGDVPPLKTN